VFQQRGIDLPLYKLVHIRPITYFIEGFATVHSLIKSDGVAMKSVGDAAAQVGPDVLNKMAEGLTFVSRKTAEAVLQGLVALEATGRLPAGTTAGLTVGCGIVGQRTNGRAVWSSKEEKIWYVPTEYLSPFAWTSMSAVEQAAVTPPPAPRNQWIQVA
jgi:hypothetical protein